MQILADQSLLVLHALLYILHKCFVCMYVLYIFFVCMFCNYVLQGEWWKCLRYSAYLAAQ